MTAGGTVDKITTLSIVLSFVFVFNGILYKIYTGVIPDSTGFLITASVIAIIGGIVITAIQLKDILLAK